MGDSLFDIVGPVMVGPSSSHTAGAVRLANLARWISTGEPGYRNTSSLIRQVEFVLYNSFAKTYRGHGTDRGLVAGMMGLGVDDDRIRDAFSLAEEQGFSYMLTPSTQANNYLPNTVLFKIVLADGQTYNILAHSIGGGKVLVSKINRYDVTIDGELPTLLLFYKDKPGMIWRVTKILAEKNINIATLHCSRTQRHVDAYMTITMDSMPDAADIDNIAAIEDIQSIKCFDRLPA
jgi:L-serine dehydratase